MAFRLVPNARRVLRHAWSLRFIELSFVLTVLGGWFAYRSLSAANAWPFLLAALCEAGAWTARFVAQAKITGVDLDG